MRKNHHIQKRLQIEIIDKIKMKEETYKKKSHDIRLPSSAWINKNPTLENGRARKIYEIVMENCKKFFQEP